MTTERGTSITSRQFLKESRPLTFASSFEDMKETIHNEFDINLPHQLLNLWNISPSDDKQLTWKKRGGDAIAFSAFLDYRPDSSSAAFRVEINRHSDESENTLRFTGTTKSQTPLTLEYSPKDEQLGLRSITVGIPRLEKSSKKHAPRKHEVEKFTFRQSEEEQTRWKLSSTHQRQSTDKSPVEIHQSSDETSDNLILIIPKAHRSETVRLPTRLPPSPN